MAWGLFLLLAFVATGLARWTRAPTRDSFPVFRPANAGREHDIASHSRRILCLLERHGPPGPVASLLLPASDQFGDSSGYSRLVPAGWKERSPWSISGSLLLA